MALPSNENLGTVRGFIIDAAGNPCTGTVDFLMAPAKLQDATATPNPTTIAAKTVTASISAGSFSQQLIPTDDPDNNPTNFTYTATFHLDGGVSLPTWTFVLPSGTTVDYTLAAPASPAEGDFSSRGTVYLLDADEDVTDLPATFPVGGLVFQKSS